MKSIKGNMHNLEIKNVMTDIKDLREESSGWDHGGCRGGGAAVQKPFSETEGMSPS